MIQEVVLQLVLVNMGIMNIILNNKIVENVVFLVLNVSWMLHFKKSVNSVKEIIEMYKIIVNVLLDFMKIKVKV